MPNETQQSPQTTAEIAQLRKELADLKSLFFKGNYSDLEVFTKKVQFNSDIKVGASIGSSTVPATGLGKVGFYDKSTAPIAQQATVTTPTGGATVDAQSRTAIGEIKTILTNLGLTT